MSIGIYLGMNTGMGYGSGAKTVVLDTFNRTDNPTSLGSADTGQPWTVLAGTWGIIGNQAYESNGLDVLKFAVVDALTPNGIIDVEAVFRTGSEIGIIFRSSDVNNFLLAYVTLTGLTLVKKVSGTTTSLGSYGFTPANGQSFTIRVNANGSAIKVSLDTIERISVSESTSSTITKHGMYKFGAPTTNRFDNFRIEV